LIPLSPRFLIAAATSFDGLREENGNNRGLMVERFLTGVGQAAGQPWCAAFVYHVGFWSHFDFRSRTSSWPLPATASCWVLGDYANRRGVLTDEPMEGDVFLVWKPELARFAHAGIVARVRETGTSPAGFRWFDCDTVEGNSNEDGDRDANAVVRRVRRFHPQLGGGRGDRFIRWVDLDRRLMLANPAA
jgi:hypothetical protein